MTRNLLLAGAGVVVAAAVAVVVPLLVIQPWSDSEGESREPSATDSPPVASASSGEADASPVTGILATTDLGLGPNRVSFLLAGPTGFVRTPEVSVTSLFFPEDGSPPSARESATARHHVWPYGVRASYSTQLTFDTPGRWAVEIAIPEEAGDFPAVRVPLNVVRDTHTPPLGAPPPRTDNKTLRDVSSLDELTTWSTPDPQLYTSTIAEAVATRDPTVVVFSSPATCTSPTCGPQAETVSQVKDKYRSDANFIHVEVYDNPHQIQGDLDNARYSPLVEAWGLTKIEGYLNESWVFILDRQGRIASKYEGYASADELESGLRAVLE